MSTETKVQVRHDCPIRFYLVKRGTDEIVDETLTTAGVLGGHIITRTIMFGGVSGHTRWMHPTTGETYPCGLSYWYEIADESFILRDGEPCPCSECVKS